MQTNRAWLLVSWLVVSCTTNTTNNVYVLQNVAPEPAIAEEPDVVEPGESITGTWFGTYACAQGLTGLVLTLEEQSDRQVTAVFEFHAIPENPRLPTGRFTMRGAVDPSRRLRLRAGRWLAQPENWVTVDLDGHISLDGMRYSGRVAGPGGSCTTFALQRAQNQ